MSFSPIFKIDTEEPSSFQEKLRARFPKVELLPTGQGATPSKAYRFQTADEQHVITLASESCTMSSRAYAGWHQFSQDTELMHRVLREVYQPPSALRLGLRYINHFTEENTGSDFLKSVELLSSNLSSAFRSSLEVGASQLLIQVVVPDDESKLAVRAARWVDPPRMVLDLDCFEERELDMDVVLEWGRRKHDLIYDAFRWCVSDEILAQFRSAVARKEDV